MSSLKMTIFSPILTKLLLSNSLVYSFRNIPTGVLNCGLQRLQRQLKRFLSSYRHHDRDSDNINPQLSAIPQCSGSHNLKLGYPPHSIRLITHSNRYSGKMDQAILLLLYTHGDQEKIVYQ